jgi:hypothetical protein
MRFGLKRQNRASAHVNSGPETTNSLGVMGHPAAAVGTSKDFPIFPAPIPRYCARLRLPVAAPTHLEPPETLLVIFFELAERGRQKHRSFRLNAAAA